MNEEIVLYEINKLRTELQDMKDKIDKVSVRKWIDLKSESSIISIDCINKISKYKTYVGGKIQYLIEFYGIDSMTNPHTVATYSSVEERNDIYDKIIQYLDLCI
jgi:hypothetical protein